MIKKGPFTPVNFNQKYFHGGYHTKQGEQLEVAELRQPIWQQIIVRDPVVNRKLSINEYHD
jgi:hypothetical protein